ncbi:MAG: haloacid dehalogenase-like hydrolase [Endomicrobium sp.]|jgi:hypothetical protein|nr:haloacid dehalogenase-like hydrolase [Endomicrobium sp.]
MNVYDFDHTIYAGDSSWDFYFFVLRHKLSLVFLWPRQIWHTTLYLLRLISKEQLKETFFVFLKYIQPPDYYIRLFWQKNFSKIKSWYLQQKRPSDLVITASPEFLIAPAAQILQVSLLGSQVDKTTGNFRGKNCSGLEKTAKFRKQYPEQIIENFYTDSKSDLPLARLAKHVFLVKGRHLLDYPFL